MTTSHERDRSGERMIDWAELHRRLEVSRIALERGLAISSEEKREILRSRARLLARDTQGAKPAFQSIEILEFLLASEHYGIEIEHIREVCPLTEFATLPGAPPFVLGLINVRGQILSIIDIRKFFDVPEKDLTDLNKVIIVEKQRMELGILADAVLGVRSIAFEDLQPSLPTLTGIRAAYLQGIAKELAVLDVEKILSDEKIVVDDQVNGST